MKKDRSRFTIQFNENNQTHCAAIKLLESLGRRKADYIANAIAHYQIVAGENSSDARDELQKYIKDTLLRIYLSQKDAIRCGSFQMDAVETTSEYIDDIGTFEQKDIENIAQTIQGFRTRD